MRIRLAVLVILSTFALGACGGSAGAKNDENVWADFKGTYSQPGESKGTTSSAKSETARRDAKSKAEAKEVAAAPEETAPAKKTSKATIKGESLSTIGEESIADASKTALKTKLLGTSSAVGAQYEIVKVQLKGANVTVIRPAATPNANGTVDSPKARNGALSKAEAGFYDEDADVLVVVDAGGKKANAQKALASIVSH